MRNILHAMHWNWASSRGEGEVSWFFSSGAGTWGILLSYSGVDHSKLVFVQRCQVSCLIMRDTSGISSRLGREIWTLLGVRQETQGTFLGATVILVFLSVFNKSQASSSFEALTSTCLSMCQRDVSPPVQIRRGPRSFSRVSRGDSEFPSSCEMKDKPAFKLLHGNLTFF